MSLTVIASLCIALLLGAFILRALMRLAFIVLVGGAVIAAAAAYYGYLP
jgi:hypothetical protein|nr:hypothetical protein [Neorhizobium tomejilense]